MSYSYHPSESPHRPVVVLLHGFVSSRAYWNKVVPLLLGEGYGVLAVDLLGFGNQRHAKNSCFTYRCQERYILSFLDKLMIDQPVILAGHSMGALVGAYFTERNPEKVSRQILLNPPLYLSPEQALATLLATGRFYRFILTSRLRGLVWGALKLLPNHIQNHSRTAREESLQNIILNEQNFRLISKPLVPSLLVIGKNDRPVYSENLKHLNPNSSLKVMVIDTNHHAPRNNPELVAQLITKKKTEI